jgi:hypothetical protein
MKDNEPTAYVPNGLWQVGDYAAKRREEEIAKHLDDIAYFIGMPIQEWTLAQWQEATRTAIGGIVALERQLYASRLANALLQPPKKKPGRPRKTVSTLRELVPKLKKGRRRIAFLKGLTDEDVKQLISDADEYETDAAFIKGFVEWWGESIPKATVGRRVMLKKLSDALPNALSKYRRAFGMMRKKR